MQTHARTNPGADAIRTLLQISVVSRRLAGNLTKLYNDEKGENPREQDERTIRANQRIARYRIGPECYR